MARLLDAGAEREGARCAVPSCRQPSPSLYDERTERYYCDRQCLEEYIAENPAELADWYRGIHLRDLS